MKVNDNEDSINLHPLETYVVACHANFYIVYIEKTKKKKEKSKK